MKYAARIIMALSLLVSSVIGVKAAVAQNSQPMTENNLPVLEQPTAWSAGSLNGIEDRAVQMDYGLLFMPSGEGGERSTLSQEWPGYYQSTLEPVAQQIAPPLIAVQLPPYAKAEIDGNTLLRPDQQRLTVQAQ